MKLIPSLCLWSTHMNLEVWKKCVQEVPTPCPRKVWASDLSPPPWLGEMCWFRTPEPSWRLVPVSRLKSRLQVLQGPTELESLVWV